MHTHSMVISTYHRIPLHSLKSKAVSHLSLFCQCPETVPRTLKGLRAVHEIELYNETKSKESEVGGRQTREAGVRKVMGMLVGGSGIGEMGEWKGACVRKRGTVPRPCLVLATTLR